MCATQLHAVGGAHLVGAQPRLCDRDCMQLQHAPVAWKPRCRRTWASPAAEGPGRRGSPSGGALPTQRGNQLLSAAEQHCAAPGGAASAYKPRQPRHWRIVALGFATDAQSEHSSIQTMGVAMPSAAADHAGRSVLPLAE